MRNDLTGRWGEETAAAYLRRRHYTIVAANYRCRLDEIDLIAENRDYLVFVEVKLRKSARRSCTYVSTRNRRSSRASM